MAVDSRPVIVWFRRDLRLTDNAALAAAAGTGQPVIACYVHESDKASPRRASDWWLHHSLTLLGHELETLGGALLLRRGPAATILAALADEAGATEVHCSASVEPDAAAAEAEVLSALAERKILLSRHTGESLFDFGQLVTQAGQPYQVFTPFWRACLASGEPGAPKPMPDGVEWYRGKSESDKLDDWALLPQSPDWAAGFGELWTPGFAGGLDRLDAFVEQALGAYADGRDRPDTDATSMLSPHLHFGELSPRQVWHAARQRSLHGLAAAGADAYLRQLVWREFSLYLLHHHPTLPMQPFKQQFRAFPWQDNPSLVRAWERGETGYPIVDAGMRQLWRVGWMHNRVRMVAASFLVKHLMVPWQRGAAWFWDTLVDADLANNCASWQWVAGCGADAAPYFRIFNPVLQGQKFDPGGRYVRRWVPELARLPNRHIQAPWLAADRTLDDAGIVLGRDYPLPIVDHKEARERALRAYSSVRQSRASPNLR